MDNRLSRKLRWFDEGAPKLRQMLDRRGLGDLLPADEDHYACPSCLMAYPRTAVEDGILTEEHVPPKGLGGRGLLLTCKNCNSNSGTDFEAHAVARSRVDDFARGKVTGRTMRATFTADGIPLRGTAQWTNEGMQLIGVSKQNDPKVAAAYMETFSSHIDRKSDSNFSVTIHDRFDDTRARISWIRSAYLAAFAALGWSYIFREVMDPYRKQLEQPDTAIVPTYVCRDPNGSPGIRQIMLVDRPDELRCVAVSLGEFTVFLPSVHRPMAAEDLTKMFLRHRGPENRLSVHLEGKWVPWPKWATYLLD